jgi:hypothetical protein
MVPTHLLTVLFDDLTESNFLFRTEQRNLLGFREWIMSNYHTHKVEIGRISGHEVWMLYGGKLQGGRGVKDTVPNVEHPRFHISQQSIFIIHSKCQTQE